MQSLFETYRPAVWADMVGQDKAVKQLRIVTRHGVGGRAYFISGHSGVGKTSISWILARELADPFNIEELDASTLTPKRLADIEATLGCCGLGAKSGRVYIINEAHAIRGASLTQLLVMLERLPEHIAIIFTTTLDVEGKKPKDRQLQTKLFKTENPADVPAFLSRCTRVHLTSRGVADAFAARVKEIAVAEGLDGRPMSAYLNLAKQCRNNMRAMLQVVDRGEMLAK